MKGENFEEVMRNRGAVRVAFICSGNICRSPYCEVVAREKFRDFGIDAQLISMGTLGIFGRGADPKMIRVGEKRGYNLLDHRSRGVNRAVLRVVDYIVVMEPSHVSFLESYYPEGRDKVVNLANYLDPVKSEIKDPIGCLQSVFEEVAKDIEEGISGFILWLSPRLKESM